MNKEYVSFNQLQDIINEPKRKCECCKRLLPEEEMSKYDYCFECIQEYNDEYPETKSEEDND